MQMTICRIVYR